MVSGSDAVSEASIIGVANSGDVRVILNAVGLKWKEVDSQKPMTGTEIVNEALATALQQKAQVSFSLQELRKFNIGELSDDSYIKAGDKYFKPADSEALVVFDMIDRLVSDPRKAPDHPLQGAVKSLQKAVAYADGKDLLKTAMETHKGDNIQECGVRISSRCKEWFDKVQHNRERIEKEAGTAIVGRSEAIKQKRRPTETTNQVPCLSFPTSSLPPSLSVSKTCFTCYVSPRPARVRA